jgi:murein DD-endopeptidase MepM/ murein hydrolase activator NlpD
MAHPAGAARHRSDMIRAVLALVLAPVLAVTPPSAPPVAQTSYAAPVASLHVVRAFEAPATPFGPGHRGVDLAVAPRAAVRAAGAGVVTFAGSVAGRGVVVIAHADGVRTEYEPLQVSVSSGARLTRGQVIGYVSGRHGDCAVSRCLHWGARRGDVYFDPLLLLHRVGPVRLLPWN